MSEDDSECLRTSSAPSLASLLHHKNRKTLGQFGIYREETVPDYLVPKKPKVNLHHSRIVILTIMASGIILVICLTLLDFAMTQTKSVPVIHYARYRQERNPNQNSQDTTPKKQSFLPTVPTSSLQLHSPATANPDPNPGCRLCSLDDEESPGEVQQIPPSSRSKRIPFGNIENKNGDDESLGTGFQSRREARRLENSRKEENVFDSGSSAQQRTHEESLGSDLQGPRHQIEPEKSRTQTHVRHDTRDLPLNANHHNHRLVISGRDTGSGTSHTDFQSSRPDGHNVQDSAPSSESDGPAASEEPSKTELRQLEISNEEKFPHTASYGMDSSVEPTPDSQRPRKPDKSPGEDSVPSTGSNAANDKAFSRMYHRQRPMRHSEKSRAEDNVSDLSNKSSKQDDASMTQAQLQTQVNEEEGSGDEGSHSRSNVSQQGSETETQGSAVDFNPDVSHLRGNFRRRTHFQNRRNFNAKFEPRSDSRKSLPKIGDQKGRVLAEKVEILTTTEFRIDESNREISTTPEGSTDSWTEVMPFQGEEFSSMSDEDKPSQSLHYVYVEPKKQSNHATKTPESQVPENQVPASQVPESLPSESKIPESHVLESKIPESHVSESKIPESHVLESKVPESHVSESKIPETRSPVVAETKKTGPRNHRRLPNRHRSRSKKKTPNQGPAKGRALLPTQIFDSSPQNPNQPQQLELVGPQIVFEKGGVFVDETAPGAERDGLDKERDGISMEQDGSSRERDGSTAERTRRPMDRRISFADFEEYPQLSNYKNLDHVKSVMDIIQYLNTESPDTKPQTGSRRPERHRQRTSVRSNTRNEPDPYSAVETVEKEITHPLDFDDTRPLQSYVPFRKHGDVFDVETGRDVDSGFGEVRLDVLPDDPKPSRILDGRVQSAVPNFIEEDRRDNYTGKVDDQEVKVLDGHGGVYSMQYPVDGINSELGLGQSQVPGPDFEEKFKKDEDRSVSHAESEKGGRRFRADDAPTPEKTYNTPEAGPDDPPLFLPNFYGTDTASYYAANPSSFLYDAVTPHPSETPSLRKIERSGLRNNERSGLRNNERSGLGNYNDLYFAFKPSDVAEINALIPAAMMDEDYPPPPARPSLPDSPDPFHVPAASHAPPMILEYVPRVTSNSDYTAAVVRKFGKEAPKVNLTIVRSDAPRTEVTRSEVARSDVGEALSGPPPPSGPGPWPAPEEIAFFGQGSQAVADFPPTAWNQTAFGEMKDHLVPPEPNERSIYHEEHPSGPAWDANSLSRNIPTQQTSNANDRVTNQSMATETRGSQGVQPQLQSRRENQAPSGHTHTQTSSHTPTHVRTRVRSKKRNRIR